MQNTKYFSFVSFIFLAISFSACNKNDEPTVIIPPASPIDLSSKSITPPLVTMFPPFEAVGLSSLI